MKPGYTSSIPSTAQPQTIEEHLRQVLDYVAPLPPVRLPIGDIHTSALRRLADDVMTKIPVPAFTNSAVDGFLVHDEDLVGEGPWTLPVIGDIPAGSAPRSVPQGAAVRVMTGAPVGEHVQGLRAIPVEATDSPTFPSAHAVPKTVTINSYTPERRHLRARGEHLAEGAVALRAGTPIDSAAIATMLSVGAPVFSVHPLPRVAVVTTGDELTRDATRSWTIPNSNGPMVIRMLHDLGVKEVSHRHLSDAVDAFTGEMDQLASTVDLIVTMGGISAGAYDVVRMAGTRRGTVEFGPVSMSPGKPQGVGHWRGTPMICLPGNPVASWVSVPLFVAPAIRRMAGGPSPTSYTEVPHLRLPASEPLLAQVGRTQVVPVRIDWTTGTVAAAKIRRSHMIGSAVGCDGLAIIRPAEETTDDDGLLCVLPVFPVL